MNFSKKTKVDKSHHTSKMKKQVDTDVEFYAKIRAHQHPETEPEENSVSAKTRNTYFSQTTSDSEASGTEGGGAVGSEVAGDEDLRDLFISQIVIDETENNFNSLDAEPTDLSISAEEL